MMAGGIVFVLCGVQLAWLDDGRAKNIWGGLSLLGLGGFAVAMAMDGISKGKLKLQYNILYRDRSPRIFWAMTAMIFAAGIGVAVGGIWAIFLKA